MDTATGIEVALGAGADGPRQMEAAYQRALKANQAQAFAAEVERLFEAAPEGVLVAAWHFRLAEKVAAQGEGRRVPWRLAVPLAAVLSLVYVALASAAFDLPQGPPLLLLAWAPVGACALILYFMLASLRERQSLWIMAPLLALLLYATWFASADQAMQQYRSLMILQLPLAAWAAVGVYLLKRASDDDDHVAFLLKSAEVVLTGGIFLGAGYLFVMITMGIFYAIGITFGDWMMRVLGAGMAGLIPVLAVAVAYDADLPPALQDFARGLARLIGTLGRVFLPLTLLVGLVYLVSIPFNFAKPFEQRDVLIVYNAMLFSVMGLIVICTPLTGQELRPALQMWLRRGLIVLAAMTVVVSLYAMSATIYRTALGGLTINRIAVIGWNSINIVLLCVYLVKQTKASAAGWLAASHATFRWGMLAYAVWTVLLIVFMPLLIVR
jgi:hypothetical protein